MFTLGALDGRRESMRMLAWVQCNLINAQIPKGKRKLNVDQIMPSKRRRDPDEYVEPTDAPDAAPAAEDEAPPLLPGTSAVEHVRALGARVRAKQEAQERRIFWSGPEGRKLRSILDE